MKRVIALAVAVFMILPAGIFSVGAAGRVSTVIAGVNTTRGADEIVIFNVSGTRTSTNQWGYEVLVDSDGRITRAGGNDSVVPEGGFVISGHGAGRTWLINNAIVGRYARYFERELMLIIDDEYIDPFYELEYTVDGVNTARLTDQLIIYRNRSTTGTNEWGYEAVVSAEGIITHAGGNNSAIPSGGFVISGHGESASILRNIVSVGLFAEFDSKTMTLKLAFNDKSLIYAVNAKIAELESYISEAEQSYILISSDADKNLALLASEAKNKINDYNNGKMAVSELSEFCENMLNRLSVLRAVNTESIPFEYRGVWIRPTETNRGAVKETVKRLYDLGANAVCIETQYDCCTIFPTPDGSLMVQNPRFGGFDVLKAYVEECHALGMELHCWMPVFYVGSTGSSNAKISVFAKRPDLFVKNQNDSYYDEDGGDFMMLDPSNPEAADFLLGLYEYIVTTYDIDCFQLDYIRYQGRGELDWGYFGGAAEQFKEKYGFYPTYNTKASWWDDWCGIRCGYVTDFVRKTRAMLDEKAGNVLLSADVFSDLHSTTDYIYQDTATWVKDGLLDILHPMTYGAQAPYAMVPAFVELCRGRCVLAPGIGAYESGVTSEVMFGQIEYFRSAGIYGGVTFESNGFFSKAVDPLIAGGVYRSPAPSPLRDRKSAVEATADYLKQKINAISLGGGYTSAEKTKVLEAVDSAADGMLSVDSAKTLYGVLSATGTAKAKNAMRVPADMILSMARLISTSTGERIAPVVKGDVNGDGEISAVDYIMVKRAVIGTYKLNETQFIAADVNNDGKIGAVDYIIIKRHVIGTYKIN